MLAPTVAALLMIGSSYLIWGTRVPVADSLPGQPDGPGSHASPSPNAPAASTPAPSPSQSPGTGPATTPGAPAESPPPQEIVLNDTSFETPPGWVVYTDELIEGDRRLVALRQGDDARLQAVTLVTTDPDLATSCRALITSQARPFTGTAELLTLPIGLDPAIGDGRTCGFTGTRTSDGVPNSVTFTLVRRATDGHVLVLRQTVPDAIALGAAPRHDLTAMTCRASAGFGVPLPLC